MKTLYDWAFGLPRTSSKNGKLVSTSGSRLWLRKLGENFVLIYRNIYSHPFERDTELAYITPRGFRILADMFVDRRYLAGRMAKVIGVSIKWPSGQKPISLCPTFSYAGQNITTSTTPKWEFSRGWVTEEAKMTTRHVDQARKLEFDKVIKKARRLYMARAKLGALDTMYAKVTDSNRVRTADVKMAKSLGSVLTELKSDDIESFGPLVQSIADYFGVWRMREGKILDHRRLFDGYIRFRKEQALRDMDIVTYK